MTAPARFTQADITRLMKGAKAAGYSRIRLIVEPSGVIGVDAGNDDPVETKGQNPLDRILIAKKKA